MLRLQHIQNIISGMPMQAVNLLQMAGAVSQASVAR